MRALLTKRPTEATFDLTAMIDVVMLLVVFFTLTSQFSRTDQSEVELPQEAGAVASAEAPNTVYLDLDRDGRMSSLGHPLTMDDLVTQVRPRGGVADPGSVQVVVRADRSLPAGRLNEVARALRSAGVERMRLATAGTGPGASPSPAPSGAGGGGGGR